MSVGGKLLLGALAVIILLAVVIFFVVWTDPMTQAGREVNQPFRIWAGRVFWIALGAGACTALMGGGLWVIGRGLHSIVKSLTIPAEHGLNPSVLLLGRFVHQQDQERYAQVVAALTNGNLDRIGAGPMKAILAPKPDENLLPLPDDDAPLPLPPKVTIYAAPLSDQLHLPVGADGNGPVQLALRDFGSGVVGGVQGMGKSEAVASMIAGLLRQDASGQHIQLAIADLKGGADFGRIPDDLPALAWPLATDPEAGLALMHHVWAEVERRQKLLHAAGAARVEVYNERPGVARLPYLLLFVDEIMMLTMAADEKGADKATKQQSAEFNGLAVRAVATGRALGVGLIAATQRPSGEVIPTRLRDLCRLRLAFKCMTQESSKSVLGVGGAELLPAEPGRALMMYGDTAPRPVRTYLADIEGGSFDGFVQRLGPSRPTEIAGTARPVLPAPTAHARLTQELDAIAAKHKATWPFAPPAAEPRVFASVAPVDLPAVTEPTPAAEPEPEAEPVALPEDVNEAAKLSAAQKQRIWRTYLATARTSRNKKPSLRATVATLYDGQEGGVKFYLVRDVVTEMRRTHGGPHASEDEA